MAKLGTGVSLIHFFACNISVIYKIIVESRGFVCNDLNYPFYNRFPMFRCHVQRQDSFKMKEISLLNTTLYKYIHTKTSDLSDSLRAGLTRKDAKRFNNIIITANARLIKNTLSFFVESDHFG